MIEVRAAKSVEEVSSTVELLDSIFTTSRGWAETRGRNTELWRGDPASLVVALEDGAVVGAAGCDGVGTINAVGVHSSYRGQGVARRLLEEVEDVLRRRGADGVGLGSVDDAVDFYLRCGYAPQLLIQFTPEASNPEGLVKELTVGVLADREIFQTEYAGSPQLWLRERAVDWDFKRRIEAVGPGVIAQYIMSKNL